MALAAASLAAARCGSPSTAAPYEFSVRVYSDPDRPLPGALLLHGNARLGTTADDGSVKLAVLGEEGEVVNLDVRCPEKFRSPPESLSITLHHLAETARLPEFVTTCPPRERSVVVAVRADGGQNLPVLYLGQEVARTDASGAAHVFLSAATDTPFELTLGTSETGALGLRPQSPTMKFIVRDRDELLLFNQRFVAVAEPHPSASRPRAPRRVTSQPQGPVLLKGSSDKPERSAPVLRRRAR